MPWNFWAKYTMRDTRALERKRTCTYHKQVTQVMTNKTHNIQLIPLRKIKCLKYIKILNFQMSQIRSYFKVELAVLVTDGIYSVVRPKIKPFVD